MAVEYLIDIDKEIESLLGSIPKRSGSAFSGDLLDDIIEVSSREIFGGGAKAQVNRELTQVFKSHKAAYRTRLIEQIEKDNGVSWDEIKDEKAYDSKGAPTIDTQLNKTWNVSIKLFRGTVIKNYDRYNKAVGHLTKERRHYLKSMGITGRTDEELMQAIAKDITNRFGQMLGINMNARENAIRLSTKTRVTYLKSLKTMTGEVLYNLGAREKHCSECLGYAGKTYRSIQEAPSLPRHTLCGCFYTKVKKKKR
jgi:hypothetical protein